MLKTNGLGNLSPPTLELLQVYGLDISPRQVLNVSDQRIGILPGLFWEAHDEALEVRIGP